MKKLLKVLRHYLPFWPDSGISVSVSFGFKWYCGYLPVLKIAWSYANTNFSDITTYCAIGNNTDDTLRAIGSEENLRRLNEEA